MEVTPVTTPVTTTVISTVTKNTLTASALPTEESTYPDTQSPSSPSSYLSPLNVQQLAGIPGNLLAFFPLKPGPLETTIGGTVYVSTTTRVFSMHTLTEYAPRASTLSTEQPGDTAAATLETAEDAPALSRSWHGHPIPGSGSEGVEDVGEKEETAVADRSELEASFRGKAGLEVIRDFFSRLFGWDEEPEENSHTTTQAPFSSSNDKEVLSALRTHYTFMFGWDADALKEWQRKRTQRWEMLDMLRDRPDNQHSAEEDLGAHLAALFGWDEKALVEWDEKRKKRRELFSKLSGSYR
jgi:hypothetical protein